MLSTVAQWIVAISGVIALTLGLRAAALQKQVDSAERTKMAAELQQARARADESLDKQRPRSLSGVQRTAFLSAAANYSKGPVTIIPLMGNAEAEQYARDLADLLSKAGYTVEKGGMLPMDNTPIGVGLTVKRGEAYPAHADGLQASFDQAKIPVGRGLNGLQADRVLGLVVGAKPVP